MRRTSSCCSGIPGGYSCYVVFQFLVYEEAYTCLSVVGPRVVGQVATLESCETFVFFRTSPNPITPHCMLLSASSSSSSCTCSSFSNVLYIVCCNFQSTPLVWWFFLTQRLLAPPVCSLGGPEPPPRHAYCWGLGALAYLYFACWFSWPTLLRWPMRVGRRYQHWSTRPRWLCLC